MATVRQFEHKNQFTIIEKNCISFQSYNSLICEFNKEKNTLTIYPNWNYSNTTRKHFYKWLSEFIGLHCMGDTFKKKVSKINNTNIIYKDAQIYC